MISLRLWNQHEIADDGGFAAESSGRVSKAALIETNSFFEPVHFERFVSRSNIDLSGREAPHRESSSVMLNGFRFSVEPTPIGPPQSMQVVDEVSAFDIIAQCHDVLGDTLIPLLNPSIRKRETKGFSSDLRKKQKLENEESTEYLAPLVPDINASVQQGLKWLKFDQWYEKYQELCLFHEKHEHCLVPHNYEHSPALAQWVKRQRHQYKLKDQGRQSTLSDQRQAALTQLGFVWDSHGAIWDKRFNELRVFKDGNYHCNVPTSHPEDPQLSIWVKCQRRQYKLYITGKKNNINPERISKLSDLGFVWNPRNLQF
jgi:hypothetical protein